MTDQARDTVAWCCRHRWTIGYIAVVSTLALVLQVLEIRGVL